MKTLLHITGISDYLGTNYNDFLKITENIRKGEEFITFQWGLENPCAKDIKKISFPKKHVSEFYRQGKDNTGQPNDFLQWNNYKAQVYSHSSGMIYPRFDIQTWDYREVFILGIDEVKHDYGTYTEMYSSILRIDEENSQKLISFLKSYGLGELK
jgi:hypothetical protein